MLPSSVSSYLPGCIAIAKKKQWGFADDGSDRADSVNYDDEEFEVVHESEFACMSNGSIHSLIDARPTLLTPRRWIKGAVPVSAGDEEAKAAACGAAELGQAPAALV